MRDHGSTTNWRTRTTPTTTRREQQLHQRRTTFNRPRRLTDFLSASSSSSSLSASSLSSLLSASASLSVSSMSVLISFDHDPEIRKVKEVLNRVFSSTRPLFNLGLVFEERKKEIFNRTVSTFGENASRKFSVQSDKNLRLAELLHE